jgi:hypothetical protein
MWLGEGAPTPAVPPPSVPLTICANTNVSRDAQVTTTAKLRHLAVDKASAASAAGNGQSFNSWQWTPLA